MSYHFSLFLYFIPLYISLIYSVFLDKVLHVLDENRKIGFGQVLTKEQDVVISSWVLAMQEVELWNTHNKVHKQNLLKNQKINNTNILCYETLSHQKIIQERTTWNYNPNTK
jgi:hypothetical protein